MNNTNKNINNLKNNMFKNLTKFLPSNNYTYFYIIIAIIIIILLVLIFRNYLKGSSMYERYVKNVFFREMDKLDGVPLDVSTGDFDVCVQGKTSNIQYIDNKFLHIKSNYLVMFWVRLESEKIGSYIENDNYENINLLSFTNNLGIDSGTKYPQFKMNVMKNEMEAIVKQDNNKMTSKIYNLPYDEWFCVSAYVTNDHMDVYINGKLVKILDYEMDIRNLSNFKMAIGPYPGSIAYLQVNNDMSYFNPASIYKEYLVYKSFIKRFTDNKYHDEYKISKMRMPSRNDANYNRATKKKNTKNVCS